MSFCNASKTNRVVIDGCMSNQNFKDQHVLVCVFRGLNSNDQNPNYQLGLHCKKTISKLHGKECEDCWYKRKFGHGCSAVISLEDFLDFAEDSNALEYSIYDSFSPIIVGKIYKTKTDDVFGACLFNCKGSMRSSFSNGKNKSYPFEYTMTVKDVKSFVSDTIRIHLANSKSKGCIKGYDKGYGKGYDKGCGKDYSKGCGKSSGKKGNFEMPNPAVSKGMYTIDPNYRPDCEWWGNDTKRQASERADAKNRNDKSSEYDSGKETPECSSNTSMSDEERANEIIKEARKKALKKHSSGSSTKVN